MAQFSWTLSIGLMFLVGADGFTCPPTDHEECAATIPLVGGKFFLPIFKHDETTNGAPKFGVITVHGAGRNADNYHGWVTNSIEKQEMHAEVVTVSPAFANKDCSAADWLGDPQAVGTAVKWSSSTRQWMFGEKSDDYEDFDGISSFEVIDDIVVWLELTYPSIQSIVVTGFSAGAQMALRWAVLSPHGVKGTTLAGTPMRIVIGSPSSVIYLNDRRPAKSCSMLIDRHVDQVNHSCHTFLVPGISSDASRTCNGKYNAYSFGIGLLERGADDTSSRRKDVSEYVHKYVHDDSLLQDTIRAHFATKTVTFMFGSTDTKDCIQGVCAGDCSAMAQGTNRLQRGLNYMYHLQDVFPGYTPDFHVFEGGHRPELFFAHDAFNQAAFGRQGWEECLWDSVECFSLLVQLICAAVAFVFGGTVCGVFCYCKRLGDAEAARQGYERDLQLALAEAQIRELNDSRGTQQFCQLLSCSR